MKPCLIFGEPRRGNRYPIGKSIGASGPAERNLSSDMNAEQIKGEIRYMSRTDKIEIYRWIDAELGDDHPSRIGLRRSLAIRQEIEQRCKGVHPEKTRNIFVQ